MAFGTPNNILATDCKLDNKKKNFKIFEFSPRFLLFVSGLPRKYWHLISYGKIWQQVKCHEIFELGFFANSKSRENQENILKIISRKSIP